MDEYKTLTTESVKSAYKKVPNKINDKITSESKKIIENKTALNRILINGEQSFFTLTDHKPIVSNNNPKTHLLKLTSATKLIFAIK